MCIEAHLEAHVYVLYIPTLLGLEEYKQSFPPTWYERNKDIGKEKKTRSRTHGGDRKARPVINHDGRRTRGVWGSNRREEDLRDRKREDRDVLSNKVNDAFSCLLTPPSGLLLL